MTENKLDRISKYSKYSRGRRLNKMNKYNISISNDGGKEWSSKKVTKEQLEELICSKEYTIVHAGDEILLYK